VKLAVKRLGKELEGKRILLKIDNKVAMAYVNRMTGRVRAMANIAREISEELLARKAVIQAIYIPSEENVEADRLSRVFETKKDVHNWTITRKRFENLDRKWGPHTVDRFADKETKQLKRFNSRLGTRGAESADALTTDWKGENNWIVPPIPLIGKVVLKLRNVLNSSSASTLEATVIVPEWKRQPWFAALREMASDEKWISRNDVIQNYATWKNEKWNLRAFRISGKEGKASGQRRVSERF